MKTLIVGGNFDTAYGKPSTVIDKIAGAFDRNSTMIINGGTLNKLKSILDGDWFISQFGVILWAPNVSNDEEKLLHKIKELNQKCILISTKQRRYEGEYTHGDIVGRLLRTHSNLGITFDVERKPFKVTVSDPLGNEYYSGYDIEKMTTELKARLREMGNYRRIGSKSIGETSGFEIDPKFIDIIHRFGNEFSKYVNAINPNRLLGNASTRCAKGFPAMRNPSGKSYFVSRRNVDKESISSKDFVVVMPNEDVVEYLGSHKPSVDTPIQIRVFNEYPEINYIIHGHVYVKNGLETSDKYPCGVVDEFDHIRHLYPPMEGITQIMVNLRGHGCFIGVRDLSQFEGIEFFSRPFPEGDSMLLPAVPAESPTPVLPTTPLVLDGNAASVALFGGMGAFR